MQHRHLPMRDIDEDIVCQDCRKVLKVGPLGVNGISPSGHNFGGRSSLANVKGDDEYAVS